MKTITLQDYKQRVLRVLVHIQQQLDEPLSLETLAQMAHFSPYHFHRVFKGMLGESVQSHIRRLRLERSAGQLKLTGWPVTQIALAARYEAPEAFTRAFRAMFGVSPSRFRAARRPANSNPTAASGVHYRNGRPLRNFKAAPLAANTMKVTIQNLPALRVAFVHHVGTYSTCGAAWDTLGMFLGKEGLVGGDSLFIGICHDDPEVTPPDKIRYDACVTVGDRFAPQGEIGVQTIAGGEYAVATHFGSYETLGETYARLMGQWLPRSGRELRPAACFEIYLNDPNSTAPEDLLTDIHVPLEPAN
jgi:AraC family transcriptional regulator